MWASAGLPNWYKGAEPSCRQGTLHFANAPMPEEGGRGIICRLPVFAASGRFCPAPPFFPPVFSSAPAGRKHILLSLIKSGKPISLSPDIVDDVAQHRRRVVHGGGVVEQDNRLPEAGEVFFYIA